MNKEKLPIDDFLKKIKPSFKVWLEVDTSTGSKMILGGGKANLLKTIVKQGSINAAADSLGLGFRTAWKLLQEINESIKTVGSEYEIIESHRGGKKGGGTSVTPFGVALVALLEELENKVEKVLLEH